MQCDAKRPCQYVDEQGQVHLVDGPAEIPARLTRSAKTAGGEVNVAPAIGDAGLLDKLGVDGATGSLSAAARSWQAHSGVHLPSLALGGAAGLLGLWLARRLWRSRRGLVARLAAVGISAAVATGGYLALRATSVTQSATLPWSLLARPASLLTPSVISAGALEPMPANPVEAAQDAARALEQRMAAERKTLERIEAAGR